MALNFNGDITSGVNHGSAANLDDLDPLTIWFWFYKRVGGAAHGWGQLINKSDTGDLALSLDNDDNLFFFRDRATTDTSVLTNTDPTGVDNKWYFLAFVFDTGGGVGEVVNIYSGDRDTPATEEGYGAVEDGAGALVTDAGGDLIVGNRAALNSSSRGDIAVIGIHNVALSLPELQDLQFRPRKRDAGCVLYAHYGFNGVGTQADWSGTGNNGTVQNAPTVSDHVPLGPPFGFDDGWVEPALIAVRIPRHPAAYNTLAIY